MGIVGGAVFSYHRRDMIERQMPMDGAVIVLARRKAARSHSSRLPEAREQAPQEALAYIKAAGCGHAAFLAGSSDGSILSSVPS
jgi:hypothetical protein